MRIHRLPVVLVLVLVAALLGAGCGGSDDASEQTAEKIIEESSGGDVDVDVDGDEVTIDSKDGSFSTSDELPKGWPDEIAMPDDTKLAGSSAIDAGEGRQLTTSGTVDGADVAEVTEHFEGEFDGWKAENSADLGEGDSAVSNRSWSKGDETATLTVTTNEGETTFVVGISAAA